MTDRKDVIFGTHGSSEEMYGMRGLPFSPAIRVPTGADLVYISGCLGPVTSDDSGSDLRSETRRVFRNMARSLELAGAGLSDIVSLTKFLADVERDNPVVAEETVRHLPHLPTSTTVEISRFVLPDARVEISAIAAVRPAASPDAT